MLKVIVAVALATTPAIALAQMSGGSAGQTGGMNGQSSTMPPSSMPSNDTGTMQPGTPGSQDMSGGQNGSNMGADQSMNGSSSSGHAKKSHHKKPSSSSSSMGNSMDSPQPHP